MNSYNTSLLVDIAPGLAAVVAALLAAFPPYVLMHQTRRGRARSAVSYILGFFAGLAATALIAKTIGFDAPDKSSIVAAGLIASFFAPFAGMLRALWRRPTRRPPRRQAFAR
jgi:hypothetical protein